jgi:hypothetical protein
VDEGGSEVDHGLETAVCLVGSHCDTFEFLQLAEEILDEVTPFVDVLVDIERLGAPLMLRDDDLRLGFVQAFDDPVGINALSAIRPPNSISLIRGAMPMVSKRWPGRRTTRTRFPSASVSARILVVQPPFDLPMARFWVPLLLPARGGEL